MEAVSRARTRGRGDGAAGAVSKARTRGRGDEGTGAGSKARTTRGRGAGGHEQAGKARRPAAGAKRGAAGGKDRSARAVPQDSSAPRGLADAPALRRAERAAAAVKTGATAKARKAAEAPEILRPAKIRLQKALAAAGVTSRRKAEELIAAGAIKVNGKRVTELGTKVDPDRDAIEVRGSRVQLEKKVYFILNKPDGVVCSAEGPKDAEGRPTVLSLFPELPQRIYPVGRLDFHTRGALIMTNDGDLAAALTHPRHEIPKTYHVKFQGKLTEAELGALAGGVTLDDGTVTRPAAEVSVIKETATNSWVQITLRQGLNRQIRRMGEAIGRPVLKLIRVAIGGLTADGLADGEFRPLTPTEVYDLMAAATPAAHPKAKARTRRGGDAPVADAGGRPRSRLAPGKRAG
nr:pseudouridine synthase [Nannocystis pusilla]